MPTSAKTKSQHGTSGPEETPLEDQNLAPEQEERSKSEASPCEKQATPAATPVGGSAKVATMSASDKKLADKMTREIAKHLGLSGKSRSFRI